MWPYLAGLVDGLSTIPRHRDVLAPNDLLEDNFPNLRFVWLRRRDTVRQAVSLWRAIQTWHWRQDAAEARNGTRPAAATRLRYSFDAIDHLRRRIETSDRCWETYFEATAAQPLNVTYEDLVENMHETLTTILCHVGVSDASAAAACRPRTARQSDELTERWVSEYAAEARVPVMP
jgi:LPS sulfotransferase NodH